MNYVEKNTKAFNELSLKLELEHFGEIALFHDGKLCGTFPDQEKAYFQGVDNFGSGTFCIFPIGRERVFRIGTLTFVADDSNYPVAQADFADKADTRWKDASSREGGRT